MPSVHLLASARCAGCSYGFSAHAWHASLSGPCRLYFSYREKPAVCFAPFFEDFPQKKHLSRSYGPTCSSITVAPPHVNQIDCDDEPDKDDAEKSHGVSVVNAWDRRDSNHSHRRASTALVRCAVASAADSPFGYSASREPLLNPDKGVSPNLVRSVASFAQGSSRHPRTLSAS